MGAELGKRLKDKVVILGRTSDDYFKDIRKLDFLMGRLSPQPSSEVIDLTTGKSGLESLIEYSDMVRKLHSKNFEWLKNNKGWIRKF
mgnify:CR=1 FL=1